jgi:hypothetical protein
MTYRVVAGIVVLSLVAASAAAGQSLGELARQEEARRKAIKTPAKIYTNESIRTQSPPPRPAPPASETPAAAAAPAMPAAAPATPSTGRPATAAAAQAQAAPPAEVKDEAYWRKRMQATRDQLGRAQIFAEALQSRINALSTDFVNRDDPAQRAVIANDRQKALAELERVKQEIALSTKAIAELQQEARRANVPPGWLR